MSRSEILWRLRQASGNHPKKPLSLERIPLRRSDNPVDTFTRRLEEAGGNVFDARELGLQECLNRVLKKTGANEIFWEDPDVLVANSIPHQIRDKNAFEENELVCSSHPKGISTLPIVLNVRPLALRHIESAKLSAGSGRLAIAETGSVFFYSGRRRMRLLLGLVPNRVTFLDVNRIVGNSQEAFSSNLPLRKSSLISLISGPSQTGDIEATLVRGVHGPTGWHVILTDPSNNQSELSDSPSPRY